MINFWGCQGDGSLDTSQEQKPRVTAMTRSATAASTQMKRQG